MFAYNGFLQNTKPDAAAALSSWENAAFMGHAEGAWLAGLAYFNGVGCDADITKASEHLQSVYQFRTEVEQAAIEVVTKFANELSYEDQREILFAGSGLAMATNDRADIDGFRAKPVTNDVEDDGFRAKPADSTAKGQSAPNFQKLSLDADLQTALRFSGRYFVQAGLESSEGEIELVRE